MAAHWDNKNSRSVPSGGNDYHSEMATFQPASTKPPSRRTPPISSFPEYYGLATPFSSPVVGNQGMSASYYEGYTIRPNDLAYREGRWSLPHTKPIPATQEDLHTEVIRQRQSDRTACRELEDCHGRKRQYIDRLIWERNASTSLGHFEVAQLRVERIPQDSGKTFDRNGSRVYHARDYKPKDLTKPRQKTLYMHIILQFMKHPNKSSADPSSNDPARSNLDVSNIHDSNKTRVVDEDTPLSSVSSDDRSRVSSGTNRRPLLARRHPYRIGDEQKGPSVSTSYISQGTQTTPPIHTGPHCNCCNGGLIDDMTFGNVPSEDTLSGTTINEEHESSGNSPSADDEVVFIDDTRVAHEFTNEPTEEESMSSNEYEKPPWFHNLRPGLLPLHFFYETSLSPELTRIKSSLLA